MLIEYNGPRDTRTEAQRVRDDAIDYFKRKKIPFKAVAEKIGISQPMFTYYFSGKTFLPEEIAKKLSQIYGFDKYYLMHGSSEYVIDDKTGEEFPILHCLIPDDNLIDEENIKPEEIQKLIKNLERKLAIMQKKYLVAEESLYAANRMIISTSISLETLYQYISNLNKKL